MSGDPDFWHLSGLSINHQLVQGGLNGRPDLPGGREGSGPVGRAVGRVIRPKQSKRVGVAAEGNVGAGACGRAVSRAKQWRQLKQTSAQRTALAWHLAAMQSACAAQTPPADMVCPWLHADIASMPALSLQPYSKLHGCQQAAASHLVKHGADTVGDAAQGALHQSVHSAKGAAAPHLVKHRAKAVGDAGVLSKNLGHVRVSGLQQGSAVIKKTT